MQNEISNCDIIFYILIDRLFDKVDFISAKFLNREQVCKQYTSFLLNKSVTVRVLWVEL